MQMTPQDRRDREAGLFPESANVNLMERDLRHAFGPEGSRPHAESFARDAVTLMELGELGEVRLYARCAARCARLATAPATTAL